MHKPSKKEITLVFDELLEKKPDVADQVHKIAFNKQCDFLLLDVVKQRVFARYNELLFSDD